MRPSIICLAAVYALLCGLSNAQNWMIDPLSCDVASGKYAFVQNTMNNALAMAGAANTALQQTPLNPAVQTALNYLFNTPDATLGTYYGNVVFGATGITRLTNQVLTNAQLGPTDVKIYCDQTRIRQVAFAGTNLFLYDSDIRQRLQEEDYDNCQIFSLSPSFMYTTLPRLSPFIQIQICPTFLNWALPTANGWTVKLSANYWKKLAVGLVQQLSKLIYAQIDAYSLFDKVMLHELTHANRAYSTVDVDNGGGVAYGWKKCHALSTVVTQPNAGNLLGDPLGPETNADNWALFGSVAWQLSTGRITGINADGSLVLA
ncbi:hypothetical protein N431DRAFT_488932 [Stipitochalara longipes BDJ]|nr:hypothetical protein N431DRAFT_488932 [Stipitochalara longipes BDJ]